MSSTAIKLSADEMQKINDIQQKFGALTIQAGKIQLAKHETTQELKRLTEMEAKSLVEYDETIQQEVELGREFENRYGSGYVDIPNGQFIRETELTNSPTGSPIDKSNAKPLQERVYPNQ